jgi:hypothetical protein
MNIINPTPELINSNIIGCLESYFDFKFPQIYKEFLLLTNGGSPKKSILSKDEEYEVRNFFGIIPDYSYGLLERKKMYENRIPNNMFPIANNSGGDLFLMSVKGPDYGKIYFWDHNWEAEEGQEPNYSNLTLVADSFDEFINGLKNESELDN